MRCVSSSVSGRAPTFDSRPLISTNGGMPGVKKRSLIFDALRSIAVSNAGVVNGADAAATAVPAGAVVVGLCGH
jgi:hypothetical protein